MHFGAIRTEWLKARFYHPVPPCRKLIWALAVLTDRAEGGPVLQCPQCKAEIQADAIFVTNVDLDFRPHTRPAVKLIASGQSSARRAVNP